MEASNIKAMRDALVMVKRIFDGRLMWQTDIRKAHEAVNAALSAPPRNCDRFATLDDARNAFFADYVPDETCSSATAFAIWIFDESKGETDGSK